MIAACGVRAAYTEMRSPMKRSLALGLTAVVFAWGCAASSGDDDDDMSGTGGVQAVGTGGVAPTGTGGTAMSSAGTGGGGMVTAGTGGSMVATAGTGGMSMGTGGMSTGTGGMGTGGTTDMTDAGMPPMSNFMPPCIRGGEDLALVGDSYINYQQNLEPRLTQRAIADGALAQGERFDDHAVAGTQLANGFALIPPQWSAADGAKNAVSTPFGGSREGPPKFMVMDGGGNDIIIANMMCEADGVGNDQNPSCQKSATDGIDAGFTMMEDMKASGVAQVLWFYYPNAPIGGADILDWAFESVSTRCHDISDDTFQCYLVDLRPVFEGKPWFAGDNIHPNSAGADGLADAVWARMKTECMAQSEASGGGCCIPQGE